MILKERKKLNEGKPKLLKSIRAGPTAAALLMIMSLCATVAADALFCTPTDHPQLKIILVLRGERQC